MSYVKLPVSEQTLKEIGDALRRAEYHHVFMPDGGIRMDEIALVLTKPHQVVCGSNEVVCMTCGRRGETVANLPPACSEVYRGR